MLSRRCYNLCDSLNKTVIAELAGDPQRRTEVEVTDPQAIDAVQRSNVRTVFDAFRSLDQCRAAVAFSPIIIDPDHSHKP